MKNHIFISRDNFADDCNLYCKKYLLFGKKYYYISLTCL